MTSERRSTLSMSLKSIQKMRSASAMSSWARSPLRVAAMMSRTPGRNWRLRGAQSAVTTFTFLPSALRTNQSAHDDPSASPSGLTFSVVQDTNYHLLTFQRLIFSEGSAESVLLWCKSCRASRLRPICGRADGRWSDRGPRPVSPCRV